MLMTGAFGKFFRQAIWRAPGGHPHPLWNRAAVLEQPATRFWRWQAVSRHPNLSKGGGVLTVGHQRSEQVEALPISVSGSQGDDTPPVALRHGFGVEVCESCRSQSAIDLVVLIRLLRRSCHDNPIIAALIRAGERPNLTAVAPTSRSQPPRLRMPDQRQPRDNPGRCFSERQRDFGVRAARSWAQALLAVISASRSETRPGRPRIARPLRIPAYQTKTPPM